MQTFLPDLDIFAQNSSSDRHIFAKIAATKRVNHPYLRRQFSVHAPANFFHLTIVSVCVCVWCITRRGKTGNFLFSEFASKQLFWNSSYYPVASLCTASQAQPTNPPSRTFRAEFIVMQQLRCAGEVSSSAMNFTLLINITFPARDLWKFHRPTPTELRCRRELSLGRRSPDSQTRAYRRSVIRA